MAQSCDPTTLANQATCINCNIPPGMYLPVLIYLFCQIATTSANSSVTTGNGSPAGVVNATGTGNIYFDLSNLAQIKMWVSSGTGTGSWNEVVGT